MNALQQFLSGIGALPVDADHGYQQFRSLDDGQGAGAAADIERIERDSDVAVVVTVWEWAETLNGTSRDRLGRLVFDESTGKLLEQESQGTPVEVARHFGGMKRMAA